MILPFEVFSYDADSLPISHEYPKLPPPRQQFYWLRNQFVSVFFRTSFLLSVFRLSIPPPPPFFSFWTNCWMEFCLLFPPLPIEVSSLSGGLLSPLQFTSLTANGERRSPPPCFNFPWYSSMHLVGCRINGVAGKSSTVLLSYVFYTFYPPFRSTFPPVANDRVRMTGYP